MYNEPKYGINQIDCIKKKGLWHTYDINFDNVY